MAVWHRMSQKTDRHDSERKRGFDYRQTDIRQTFAILELLLQLKILVLKYNLVNSSD